MYVRGVVPAGGPAVRENREQVRPENRNYSDLKQQPMHKP